MNQIEIASAGCVSPYGRGVGSLWDGVCQKKNAFSIVSSFGLNSFSHRVAALFPEESQNPKSRASFLSSLAICEALEGLGGHSLKGREIGVYIATGHGEVSGLAVVNEFFADSASKDTGQLSPTDWEDAFIDSISKNLKSDHPIADSYVTYVCGACASASQAIGEAANHLRIGWVDVALVVSVEIFARMGHVGFARVGALSKNRISPFSINRQGTIMGEAATAFVLQRSDRAVLQRPLGHLVGIASTCDAYHPMTQEPTGDMVFEAICRAVNDASIPMQKIDAIYLHGTGTETNDRIEGAAVTKAFDGRPPPSTAIKSLVGHSLGASAGVSMVCALKSIESGLLPSIGSEDVDDTLLSNIVEGSPVRLNNSRNILVNALGFGGLNTSMVLSSSIRI